MIRRTRAKWSQLSDQQRRRFGNGCGPAWMDKSRAGLWLKEHLFNWFFDASCARHDFGYIKGGTARDKLDCDWKFLQAMGRDVDRLRRHKRYGKCLVACLLMPAYYGAVMLGGWFSFHFGDQRSLNQILAQDKREKANKSK